MTALDLAKEGLPLPKTQKAPAKLMFGWGRIVFKGLRNRVQQTKGLQEVRRSAPN